MCGVERVYHIAPNMHPAEVEIGRLVLLAAEQAGVRRFVFHSVLHPQTEEMPHHWNKLRVEEMIFRSRLDFTILQPCAYMQNILGYWESIRRDGVYAVPYAVGARLSVVDLEDVAEAAARVLCEDGHAGATYELAGPQALSQSDQAAAAARVLGRPVRAEILDRTTWRQRMQEKGMPPYELETLTRMFEYYEKYGLRGCPNALQYLLGRSPRTFEEFLARWVMGETANG